MSFQKIANISGFDCVREVVLRPYRKGLALKPREEIEPNPNSESQSRIPLPNRCADALESLECCVRAKCHAEHFSKLWFRRCTSLPNAHSL